MATGIRQCFYLQKTLRCHGVVKLRAWHGVGQGNLNGFAIQFLGEFDGFLNGLFRLARQANDEVAMHLDSILAAMLAEVARHLQRRALLDVLQDLRVARFESHDKQPRSRFRHSSDRFLIAVHARG